jgi:hypothetical protein
MTLDRWTFLGMNVFVSFIVFLTVIGISQCGNSATCQDCITRCRPFDVSACNLDKAPGEFRATCVCVDKMETRKP